MYYDKNGSPITILEWGRLLEDHTYKRVAIDDIPGGRLSTVWLGLDHGFQGDNSPPIIFETMDFPANDIQERYSTLEEARAGHARIMAELRSKPANS